MAPENNGHSPEADLILINGGVDMEVTLVGGAKETVKVRQLPIKAMLGYLSCFDDEPKLIALFTGKPETWVDELTPQSHTALIEKGEEINRPFFDAWYRRRMDRIETINPGFRKNLASIVGRATADAARSAAPAGSVSANSASASPIAPG
jgi:hypothetical protein